MTMVYQEQLYKETFEIRSDGQSAIFVHIQGRVASVYPSLQDYVGGVFLGQSVPKFTCDEGDLDELYHSEAYDFKSINELYQECRSRDIDTIAHKCRDMNLNDQEFLLFVQKLKRAK